MTDLLFLLNELTARWFPLNQNIPNGRDNIERILLQELHFGLEFAFFFQTPLLIFFIIHELFYFPPYWNNGLTVIDWYCTTLAHIAIIPLILSLYFSYRRDRKKAYLIHIPNQFVVIFLSSAILFICLLYYKTGTCFRENGACEFHKSYISKTKYFMAELGILNLKLLCENIQIYFKLKLHQRILDTITQLPYKPRGA